MARTYAYLFGFGATLALLTLALPGAEGRDTLGMVAAAIAGYLTAAGFIGFIGLMVLAWMHLPLWAALLSAPAAMILLSSAATSRP